MAIFGIEGGIGTGKTLTGVYLLVQDLLSDKTIYSNVRLKNIPKKFEKNINYLTKDFVTKIFEKVKNGEINMANSTVFLQEAHNYIDSRNAMSVKNKTIGYWILQSRHTGQGSCDIIYDTQSLGQVDIRLRRNTDYVIRPQIIVWEENKGKRKPKIIKYECLAKIGHEWRTFKQRIDVSEARNQYDTHELVDF